MRTPMFILDSRVVLFWNPNRKGDQEAGNLFWDKGRKWSESVDGCDFHILEQTTKITNQEVENFESAQS